MRVIQYLRPDGRQVAVEAECSDEVEKMGHELDAAGCRVELELLRTGHVSIEVVRWSGGQRAKGEDPESLAHEIVANGPEVPGTLELVVRTVYGIIQAERMARDPRSWVT